MSEAKTIIVDCPSCGNAMGWTKGETLRPGDVCDICEATQEKDVRIAELERERDEALAKVERWFDLERTLSCGHTYTHRHTACPTCFAEVKTDLDASEARVAELSGALERVRDLRASSILGVTTIDVLGMVREIARAALAAAPGTEPPTTDTTLSFLSQVITAADAGYDALHCEAKPGLDYEARNLLCLLRDEARRQRGIWLRRQAVEDAQPPPSGAGEGEAAELAPAPGKEDDLGQE